MGFFSIISDANEDAHGERLKRGMQDTLHLLSTFEDMARAKTLMKFLDKKQKLSSSPQNFTAKNRIAMGRLMQDEARKLYDIDRPESFALWMAGAWIESMERRSSAACLVHEYLSELADALEKA